MSAEVLIIGGGLAGSAAAICLARAGRGVVLLEKESQPQHKVCGEFLSQEALLYLESLGVDVAKLGAVGIGHVRLARHSAVSKAALPFQAMSVTRRRLDEELLRQAEHAGAEVVRGCHVHSLRQEANLWSATCEHGLRIAAPTAFLGTGKHDLHGHARPTGRQSDLVAFKMYFRLASEQADALADHVELILYREGYGGLQLVEDGLANLCCLVRRSELQRLGNRWEQLLEAMRQDCSHLRRRLEGAEPLLPKPLAITAIPYGFVRSRCDGFWALGDQAAVIPSFTGDGMSIALHSGCLAASMYLRGQTAEAFQARLHEEVASQISFATMISRGLLNERTRSLLATAAIGCPPILRMVAARTRIARNAVNLPVLACGVSAQAGSLSSL